MNFGEQSPIQPKCNPNNIPASMAHDFQRQLYLLQGLYRIATEERPVGQDVLLGEMGMLSVNMRAGLSTQDYLAENEAATRDFQFIGNGPGGCTLGYGLTIPEANHKNLKDHNRAIQSLLMFNFPSEIDRVLTIIFNLTPRPLDVEWFNLTHIRIEAQICLGDIFELSRFLPSLRMLVSVATVNHSTANDEGPRATGHIPFEDVSDKYVREHLEDDEQIDISEYADWEQMHGKPLNNPLFTRIVIEYDCATSARSIYTSERLCRWFFGNACNVEVTGVMHRRINGRWDCPITWTCDFHANLE